MTVNDHFGDNDKIIAEERRDFIENNECPYESLNQLMQKKTEPDLAMHQNKLSIGYLDAKENKPKNTI